MISEMQAAVRQQKLDGWLFFDHHRRDPLAYNILGLSREMRPSRRWYYLIPAEGTPKKLVHRIESHVLDSLPGEVSEYSSWIEQNHNLHDLLSGCKRIAMQYSPNCAIPYVSMVDAGTLELVRKAGVEVVSSSELVQEFEACWSSAQLAGHQLAGKKVDQVRRDAFEFVRTQLTENAVVSEFDVQQFILKRFFQEELVTDHGPIVAVNENASDPHYEPSASHHRQIRKGDVLLIDLWAKLNQEQSVYYDITWTGFCGEAVPSEVENTFNIVMGARKAASTLVATKVEQHEVLQGWQVDDAARSFVKERDMAQFFIHRTGHSIGTEVHGNGANMDNLECHDDRLVIPNTCFSIEPGIYLPRFGVRSEVNMFVSHEKAWITGEEQQALIRLAV